jgi:hypothetical protein
LFDLFARNSFKESQFVGIPEPEDIVIITDLIFFKDLDEFIFPSGP